MCACVTECKGRLFIYTQSPHRGRYFRGEQNKFGLACLDKVQFKTRLDV